MTKDKRKISHISAMHFVKLAIRLAIAVAVLAIYIVNQAWNSETILGNEITDWVVLGVIFGMFLIEIILRFFPSKMESMGCQKQFKRNYRPTCEMTPQKQSWKRTLVVVVSWLVLNGAIGALYFCNVIDKGILIIISLAYSVCDMICILFFCPFQVLMMKNKCCTTCRIYNWDFPMMFTPFVFMISFSTWELTNIFIYGLIAASLALLLEWEITYRLHPERFTENTNQSLACANCKEKLCHHKKHLRRFIKISLSKLAKKEVEQEAEQE